MNAEKGEFRWSLVVVRYLSLVVFPIEAKNNSTHELNACNNPEVKLHHWPRSSVKKQVYQKLGVNDYQMLDRKRLNSNHLSALLPLDDKDQCYIFCTITAIPRRTVMFKRVKWVPLLWMFGFTSENENFTPPQSDTNQTTSLILRMDGCGQAYLSFHHFLRCRSKISCYFPLRIYLSWGKDLNFIPLGS